jgi:hypothetical protein
MKILIGIVLLAMGLLAGVVLLLAPFGMGPLEAGPLMWFAFPLGSVGGHIVLMLGASRARMAISGLLVGGALLLLGLTATVAQFLVSGGLLAAAEDTFSFWYVASGGFVLGGVAYALRTTGKSELPAS